MGEQHQGSGPEPRFGVASVEDLRKLSGMDFLHGIFAGRFPRPPIGQTLGFEPIEIEKGRTVFVGTPEMRHYNPIGVVHGGYAATLLDSCMGCAVHSALEAGQGYTTLELKINYVKALTEKTGRVRAEGKIINVGRQVATAEGRLIDENGKLYAHGTTTCLIFPI